MSPTRRDLGVVSLGAESALCVQKAKWTRYFMEASYQCCSSSISGASSSRHMWGHTFLPSCGYLKLWDLLGQDMRASKIQVICTTLPFSSHSRGWTLWQSRNLNENNVESISHWPEIVMKHHTNFFKKPLLLWTTSRSSSAKEGYIERDRRIAPQVSEPSPFWIYRLPKGLPHSCPWICLANVAFKLTVVHFFPFKPKSCN